MIKLYYGDISRLNADNLPSQMSEYRMEKLSKIKPQLNKKQSIGAELLLNHAVRDNCPEIALPLSIETDYNGKPFCRDLPFHFNLSHSGNLVICATADFELGADIQKLSPYKEKLAQRQFSVSENAYILNSEDRNSAFTEVWCRKESCIKALGIGIRLDLSSFSAVPDSDIILCGRKLSIRSGNIEGSFVSLCTIGKPVCEVDIIKVEL